MRDLPKELSYTAFGSLRYESYMMLLHATESNWVEFRKLLSKALEIFGDKLSPEDISLHGNAYQRFLKASRLMDLYGLIECRTDERLLCCKRTAHGDSALVLLKKFQATNPEYQPLVMNTTSRRILGSMTFTRISLKTIMRYGQFRETQGQTVRHHLRRFAAAGLIEKKGKSKGDTKYKRIPLVPRLVVDKGLDD